MSFEWWWADRADHVHPPHLKWPGRGCRAEISWCSMNEITMDVASFGISDGIWDHLRPIISQSSESISKLRTRLMSYIQAIMHFFEYFLCLFLRQTAEEDPIMRSVIQCSRDRIIVEFGGFPSNSSRFFGIIRQDVIQGIVDVRESPIPRLWPVDVSRGSLAWQSPVGFWWYSKVILGEYKLWL